MITLRDWLTASRALFSITIVLPCIVGGVIAFHDGVLNLPLLMLATVGAFFGNIAANFTNDYYDYKSGVDALDIGRQFKKGSEILLKNGLSYSVVRRSIIGSLAATTVIGVYFILAVDWRMLLFGFGGMLIAYFYTAPPVKLGYRGFGELASGFANGPLPVVGTYFLLTRQMGVDAIVASIPIGMLVASILYVGNVPDADADRQVGKRTISVRLGREAIRILGPAFYATTYLIITIGVAVRWLPLWSLLSLLTIPLVVRLLRGTSKYYDDIPRYAPAIMTTVKVFAYTTVLIAVGFLIDAIL
jgi:1,4-dihydroxy-2-naphthoate octaprenyltransferase